MTSQALFVGRHKLVAGNWKMTHTVEATQAFFDALAPLWTAAKPTVQGLICPTALSLTTALASARTFSNLAIGAQNAYPKPDGAFTGEVSMAMLKATGVPAVIVGHSERRTIFGECNTLIAEKVVAALAEGITPILCVGESQAERDAGSTETVIAEQLSAVANVLSSEQWPHVVIAYEPIWAIGTGNTCAADEANRVCGWIRQWINQTASTTNVTILYGGSVNPGNAAELFSQSDIDGGLVGGASIKAESFMALVNAMQAVTKPLSTV